MNGTFAPPRIDLIVLSGLSGAGKSTAIHALEDAGYFCVDNLPSPLIEVFLRLTSDHKDIQRAAVAMDIREARFYPDVARELAAMRAQGYRLDVLYLDASDEQLINRYKETRRRHPLMAHGDAQTIGEAIGQERALLEPIRALANAVIDTSQVTVHDLKRRIQLLYGDAETVRTQLNLLSFGFRRGLPPEADYVFDVRFLPNPYFTEALREKSGLDDSVAEWVMAHPAAQMLLDHVESLLCDVLPHIEEEGKASVTFAIGCTGGRHRSVVLVETLRKRLAKRGRDPVVSHRDVALGAGGVG
jgi:UPF0042 nucleotide-binding protein